jgi:hypothetical protein
VSGRRIRTSGDRRGPIAPVLQSMDLVPPLVDSVPRSGDSVPLFVDCDLSFANLFRDWRLVRFDLTKCDHDFANFETN